MAVWEIYDIGQEHQRDKPIRLPNEERAQEFGFG
ncbi:hypothetical protein DYBT9275_01451 [Dyadobacter sp. CECT 9275]|uniref:Uncharacterized protein n=1 Tax=Dyadobacter helix TaxID=2822344 RepID=A0A916N3E9_9BACT|nr:hypothetical protein DYBT9275_01451 [Dyadobacter sp. CECT 9275]